MNIPGRVTTKTVSCNLKPYSILHRSVVFPLHPLSLKSTLKSTPIIMYLKFLNSGVNISYKRLIKIVKLLRDLQVYMEMQTELVTLITTVENYTNFWPNLYRREIRKLILNHLII